MTSSPLPIAPTERRALRAIALFKFAKALTCLALAATAFGLLGETARAGAVATLAGIAAALARATEFPGVRGWFGGLLEQTLLAVLRWLGEATPSRLQVTGLIALGYGLMLGVEGTGLWQGRTWAEWFSVLLTASLIPFEVWEVTHRLSPLRVGILALNLAVVWYLVATLRAHRAANAATRHAGERAP